MKRGQFIFSSRTATREHGGYLVEFALTYALFMFVLLGCVEVARVMFTWSALNHATQRGARVAAVCPVNDAQIGQIAIFGEQGTTASSLIPGINAGNILVEYQNASGGGTTDYADIRYVTVSVNAYTHQMLVPDLIAGFVSPTISAPTFSTTLPAESLGYSPDTQTRVCFS